MSTITAVEQAEATQLSQEQSVMSWPSPEHGDLKKIWSRSNADEVADARRSFEELTKKGFCAFHVRGEKGERGERMNTFDPNVERMVLIPPLVGG